VSSGLAKVAGLRPGSVSCPTTTTVTGGN
jgi:hypothetical protein